MDDLNPGGRSRIDHLLARQWSVAADHPLAALQGKEIGPYELLVLLGPKNNVGSRYFQLFLAGARGTLSDDPLALGLFGSGPYPAFNWVELTHYEPVVALAGRRSDIRRAGHDLALFEMLSALVPAGGHLMVEYDSPSQEATARVLTLGYPPATSPIGYRLFQAGARSYRDWYISEGGREGPRKLQGFKPLNEEIAREKTAALLVEVRAVLAARQGHGEWGEIARRNAAAVVQALNTA
jgi:hypothetical protein